VKLIIDALLGGVLAPAGFAVIVLLSIRRLRPGSPTVGELAGAVALGGGFLLAFALLRLAPWWPEQGWHWLPYAAAAACAAGVVESAGRLPSVAVWALRLVVALMAGGLLVPSWESIAAHRTWWILGLAGGVLLLWAALGATAERLPTLRQSFLLGLIWPAVAVIMEQSGSAKFVQLAVVVAALLGAFWLVDLIRKWRPAAGRTNSVPPFEVCALRGAAPGIAVLLPGLTLNGYFASFSEVPLASYLLVISAPPALYLATVGRLRQLSTRAALIVQSVVMLTVLVCSVGLALAIEGL
jgi:hypothetical protein